METPRKVYANDQEAAKGLLGEATEIISKSGIDYVILGGWVPFLFYSTNYPHPGTFDVDILMNSRTKKTEMEAAVELFIRNGYRFAAKNKFQLHRIFNVNGEEILFHVDFLHEQYAPDQTDGMFLEWNKMQSIAGPGTDIIFLNNERNSELVEIELPNGENRKISINFASEIGFISAKSRSIESAKRIRDSYDIFLIINQSKDLGNLYEKANTYYRTTPYFRRSIDSLNSFFESGRVVDNTIIFLEKLEVKLKTYLKIYIPL